MKPKFRYLMAPEDDDLGGSGGGEDFNLDPNFIDNSDDEGGSGDEGQQGGGGGGGIDINAFQTAMANAIKTAMPQPQGQQQQALSQEEIDKRTKKFLANEEIAAQLFNPEATPAQRAQILNQIINGVTEHALTVSGLMQKYSTDQLRGELTPIQQHLEEMKLKDFTRTVTLEFPGLKGKDQLIHAAISQLNTMGINPKSKKEAIRMVGNAVAAYAKQIDPNFALIPQQQQQGGRGTARLTMGNAGGGGNRGAQGQGKKPAWQTLFG